MVLLDINDLIAGVGGIFFFVLFLVLILIVQIFSLKVGIGSVKGKNTTMGSVFITGLINFVAMFLLIFFLPWYLGWLIAIIVGLLIIKIRHETTFFGALGAVIISWIIIIILIIVIAMLIGTTLNVLLGYLLP